MHVNVKGFRGELLPRADGRVKGLVRRGELKLMLDFNPAWCPGEHTVEEMARHIVMQIDYITTWCKHPAYLASLERSIDMEYGPGPPENDYAGWCYYHAWSAFCTQGLPPTPMLRFA